MFVCLYVCKYAELPLPVWLNTDWFIIENKSLLWAEEEAEDLGRVEEWSGCVIILVWVLVPSFPTYICLSASLCFSVLCLLAVPHPCCFPTASFFAFLQSLSLSPPPMSFTSVYSLVPTTCIHIPPMMFSFYSPSFPLFVFLSYPMEDLGVCKRYYFIGIMN